MEDIDFALNAISSIDGRNHSQTKILTKYFSEHALIKFRVESEIKYLIFFFKIILKKPINSLQEKKLLEIISKFDLTETKKVKEIEKVTNHDVKAIEYYLQPIVKNILPEGKEYIHFGLTSEDINSIAYSWIIQKSLKEIIFPELKLLTSEVLRLANQNKKISMLARTHGQFAIPTTLGKEIAIFGNRIQKEINLLKKIEIEAKLSGAVGNFNALSSSFPNIDWIKTSDKFISSLGLKPNHITTQILDGDAWSRVLDSLSRINTILIGFNQDIWRYISDGIFKLKIVENEIGSSTMPHKINPINFENSEGNLKIANSLLNFISHDLLISRLQRDLSGSTVRRNIGTAFAFSLVGYISCLSGLKKIATNNNVLNHELENHWEVLTEEIQTILRNEGIENAYETIKKTSRGKELNKIEFTKIISSLKINNKIKKRLYKLNPKDYVGLAEKLVNETLEKND
jgi:adenylosuccinate lyase